MRIALITLLLLVLCPAVVLAQRGGPTRELTAAQIQRLARSAVGEVLPQGLELRDVQWNQAMRIPRGDVDAVAYLEGDEPTRDRMRARVEVFVNDESFRTIRVRLLVSDRRQVVVATRQLRPGTVIGPNDVSLRTAPPGVYLRSPLRSLDQAVGNVVSQSTDSGEVLEQNEVRPPAAVRRRERVRIIARAGGIEVIAQGEPLQDGAIGEVIRVMCLMTRRTIEARVTRPGEVEVR